MHNLCSNMWLCLHTLLNRYNKKNFAILIIHNGGTLANEDSPVKSHRKNYNVTSNFSIWPPVTSKELMLLVTAFSRQLCHKHGTENNLSHTFGTLQIKQLSYVWNNNYVMLGLFPKVRTCQPDHDQTCNIVILITTWMIWLTVLINGRGPWYITH